MEKRNRCAILGDGLAAMWAVLPIKDLAHAKQRLARVLTPSERRRLFTAMVEDVLAALAEVTSLDGVAVITKDDAAKALGDRYGARILSESENRGQTAAVSAAASTLLAEGVDGMVQVPGDIPLVTAADIAQVIAAHGAAPAMTIVPARDERGSNCVVCSPPSAVPLRFGNDSFHPHLASARRLGITPHILHNERLGLDVDTPDDLAAFLARPSETRAYACVVELGLDGRPLRDPVVRRASV